MGLTPERLAELRDERTNKRFNRLIRTLEDAICNTDKVAQIHEEDAEEINFEDEDRDSLRKRSCTEYIFIKHLFMAQAVAEHFQTNGFDTQLVPHGDGHRLYVSWANATSEKSPDVWNVTDDPVPEECEDEVEAG
jgi:hypothetical protein